MPRPSIDTFWREQVRSITANNPKLGTAPVLAKLQAIGRETGRSDWPSERTVGRIQREFRLLGDQDQREYLDFYWPEAMERGDLPWEASNVALKALDHLDAGGLPIGPWKGAKRPSVAAVRWMWRLTLARPDLPLPSLVLFGLVIAHSERTGLPRRDVEAWLARVDREGGSFFGHFTEGEPWLPLVENLAAATAVEAVALTLSYYQQFGVMPWERTPTETELSTDEKTGDGAPR